MGKKKRKLTTAVAAAILLNVILIVSVICSVFFAFKEAEDVSFTQNVENVRTLTDAAANKIELEISHHRQEVEIMSRYAENYNGVGMTRQELRDYFTECRNGVEPYTWQLVDNTISGASASYMGFSAISLSEGTEDSFSYRAKAYPELAKLFVRAGEDTLGQTLCTSEFTDSSPKLAKSFAITTTLRVRAPEEAGGYVYNTLMLLLRSDYINEMINTNNNIDSLSFFDFSGIIVDDSGNYVISNSNFQGTNFTDYIELYNEGFTKEDAESLRAQLKQEDYSQNLYYKNNRYEDCVYTIVPVQNSDWHILSIVPIRSFHNADHFSGNYIRFFVAFLLLFAVDMAFVLQLNHQLRRKKLEAEAASVAKSQFLSSMSHDIRTPMNAIIGMTVIANDTLAEKEPDKETLKDCVKTIELSGNHLLTLINDILDISKIESGMVFLSLDDFSISETMGKMLEIIQPKIKEKEFVFETHILNVTHEFVHGDELRINQVFLNILSNAIKYTEPGGRITVDLSEEAIAERPDMARFVYRVADNGIGMDPEFQKTIFERFTRAVDSRINVVQGTGLGMSIVKQLVDLMGGTIEVESQLNVGSVFTVTLDLPVADRQVETVSLDGLSALLIDDDSVLLKTAELSLVSAGMEVQTTDRGRTGIQMAADRRDNGKPYDVILVDWKMNEMNGVEVVRELRRQLGPTAKILVMTAYSIADIEREGRSVGVNGFVTKPLFRSKLLRAIQTQFADGSAEKESVKRQSYDLNVLVAEDNHVNWRVLQKILNRYGLSPRRAENGQTALDIVRDSGELYDLILMDIQMPLMNGYEATQAIRSLPDAEKAATPIYAMTADTFAEDVARCIDVGMNGHLSKPIEIDKLLKVLGKVSKRSGQDKQ